MVRYELPTNDELELKRRTFGGVDRTWTSKEFNLMVATAIETGHSDYVAILALARKDEIFQNTAKTKSSNREFPINDVMFKYLTELKAKQNENKVFLGDRYNTSDFVCCWDDGEPVKVTYISHMFTKLLADNNLPHIRLHDLRHSCATNLLKKGVDIKIIQEYLGHSTIATTANFYLHPDMEQKKDAIERLSQAFTI